VSFLWNLEAASPSAPPRKPNHAVILHAAWFCARRADVGWRPTWITPCKPQAQPGIETASRCLNCRDAMHRVSTPELRSACTGVWRPEARAKQCTKPSRAQYNKVSPLQSNLSRRDSTLLTAGFNLRTAMQSVPQVPQRRRFEPVYLIYFLFPRGNQPL
jgi:hypothetical protein